MKIIALLIALAGVLAVLRFLSNRLAEHRTLIPNPLSKINTQVHRINQR
jgi:hypothetical protein